MESRDRDNSRINSIWQRMLNLEGDKVILIIILLLILISFLAIFSSTPLLPAQSSRLATMKDHGIVVFLGIAVMFILYHFNIKWIKKLSQWGFLLSFVMLVMLLCRIDLGFIKTQTINGALRNFIVAGYQIHVFEVVKVAMVLYLSWAMTAIDEDKAAMKEGRKSDTLSFANWLGTHPSLAFLKKTLWKRILYVYLPSIIICLLIFPGSGSSAIFVGAIMIAAMFIGGVPFKELAIAGLIGVAGLGSMLAIYKISDGQLMKRAGTIISRMKVEYDMDRLEGLSGDKFYNMLDTLRQPVSAKIAVHEGRLLGKGIGNSTQKYKVENIYGDYMYSFIIEEYGMAGGILVLILYISLLARSVIISRMSDDHFARLAVGSLAILITGQAFMHIMVNVDIGPMTGQTLPLISHGASAYLVFCVAFGIILCISRKARKKIQSAEELTENSRNDIEANMVAAEKVKE